MLRLLIFFCIALVIIVVVGGFVIVVSAQNKDRQDKPTRKTPEHRAQEEQTPSTFSPSFLSDNDFIMWGEDLPLDRKTPYIKDHVSSFSNINISTERRTWVFNIRQQGESIYLYNDVIVSAVEDTIEVLMRHEDDEFKNRVEDIWKEIFSSIRKLNLIWEHRHDSNQSLREKLETFWETESQSILQELEDSLLSLKQELSLQDDYSARLKFNDFLDEYYNK